MYEKSDTFNQVLTDYAQGIYLNPGDELDLARLFFGTVAVEAAVGQYDVYDSGPALSAVDARLPRDNSPHRIQLNRKPGFWNCTPQALEIATWKPMLLQKSGHVNREDAVRTLMSAQFATRQVQAVEAVKAAVPAGTVGTGDWSTDTTPVLEQLETLCRTVVENTGVRPTHLVLGHAAWNLLRNHKTLEGRFHALDYALKEDALLSMLSYRGVKLVVADTMARVDGVLTPLLDHDVIVMHQQEAPTRTDLSLGKEFTLSPNGPEVLSYVEHGINDVDVLMWSSDLKVTNAAAAARIVVS